MPKTKKGGCFPCALFGLFIKRACLLKSVLSNKHRDSRVLSVNTFESFEAKNNECDRKDSLASPGLCVALTGSCCLENLFCREVFGTDSTRWRERGNTHVVASVFKQAKEHFSLERHIAGATVCSHPAGKHLPPWLRTSAVLIPVGRLPLGQRRGICSHLGHHLPIMLSTTLPPLTVDTAKE